MPPPLLDNPPLTGWVRIAHDIDTALFVAWPIGIAAVALNTLAKRSMRPAIVAYFIVVAGLIIADDMLAEEEERHLVTAQLKSANPMQQILIAHDIEGLPMAEIAKEQRVPLSTAYRWRASALSALQKEARRRVREPRLP
jgi:DNA-directed RNA polymerase specialized sigma24 family protein